MGSSSYKTPQKKASCSPLLYVILGFLLVKPLQDKGEQIETAHESEASSIDDIESPPPLTPRRKRGMRKISELNGTQRKNSATDSK